MHAITKGTEYLSFEEAIENEEERLKNDIFKGYLKRGIYTEQINRYLNFFHKDQMYFLLYENFAKSPEKELKGLFDFLGVEPGRYKYIEKKKNQTIIPRFPKSLYLLRKYTGKSIPYKMVSQMNKLGKKPGYDQLDQNTKGRLNQYFKPYNKELENLLDIDLSLWER
ncbi:MAG: sulfotransferase domain-containing protein [Methanolobus sp.]